VTPTGAAILATMTRFETPAIAIEQVGYGFGRQHFPWPNCLRLCIGSARGLLDAEEQAATDWVTVIESNVDNMSGELLGDLMDELLAAGALDVSYTPIQMKKNRPAVMVSLICSVEDGDRMAQVVLRESSTLGVRIQQIQRLKAQRTQERINTAIGTIVVKVKRLGSRIISASPEYEECRRIARERNMPLDEVYAVVQQAIAALF
jgi:pyridinium-3,5-bisthiocarboxylic acid mononucleotide nickel chelatase